MRKLSPFVFFAAVLLTLSLFGCGGGNSGSNLSSPPPNSKVPLIDMTPTDNYMGYPGGLYPGGSNTMPSGHDTSGVAAAAQIKPLDASGNPSPNGEIVFLGLGMSHVWYEFGQYFVPITIPANQGAINPQMAVVNGGQLGVTACYWTLTSGVLQNCDPPDPVNTPCGGSLINPYDQVVQCFIPANFGLGPNLTEKQVQVAWLKQADRDPGPNHWASLCDVSQPGCTNDDQHTDALRLEKLMAEDLRAAKIRYPNLRQVFISSRSYAGYATSTLNPEPYAYESSFAVKWLIQAQITQEQLGTIDPVAGDLSVGIAAPWIAWGPYLWANGTTPNSQGTFWCNGQAGPPCNGEMDFRPDDHTHPTGGPKGGQAKVSNLLFKFFSTSKFTPWFR
jgi:hypothetical protein